MQKNCLKLDENASYSDLKRNNFIIDFLAIFRTRKLIWEEEKYGSPRGSYLISAVFQRC